MKNKDKTEEVNDREINLLIMEYMDYTIWGFKQTANNILRAQFSNGKIPIGESEGYVMQFPFKNDASLLFDILDRFRHIGASVNLNIGTTYICTIRIEAPQWSVATTNGSNKSITEAMYYAIGSILHTYKSKQ